MRAVKGNLGHSSKEETMRIGRLVVRPEKKNMRGQIRWSPIARLKVRRGEVLQ